MLAAGLALSPEAQATSSSHSGVDWQPAAVLGDLADNEDFWANFVQYGRFFTSVLVRLSCMRSTVTDAGAQQRCARSWGRHTLP